jgi:hypothetical protein
VRALLLALAVAGCWTGSPPETEPPGKPAGKPAVHVRMADADDFANAPRITDPFDAKFGEDCLPWGEPAPELFAPIVAFARKHLVKDLDTFGLGPSAKVYTRHLIPKAPEPPWVLGINITVTPMTELGPMEVSNVWRDGHHTRTYCFRVLHEGDATVVAIKPQLDLITAAEPPPAPPAPAQT